MTKGKGSPNWVRYDKAGKVVERRWYAAGPAVVAVDQVAPPVDQVMPRRVQRGVRATPLIQDKLL